MTLSSRSTILSFNLVKLSVASSFTLVFNHSFTFWIHHCWVANHFWYSVTLILKTKRTHWFLNIVELCMASRFQFFFALSYKLNLTLNLHWFTNHFWNIMTSLLLGKLAI